jgi:hypothetical protein
MTQATGIEVVAPIDASDDYCRRIPPAWKGVDVHIEAAQIFVPPDDILAAIAPGHAAVAADREKYAPASVQKFVGNLTA